MPYKWVKQKLIFQNVLVLFPTTFTQITVVFYKRIHELTFILLLKLYTTNVYGSKEQKFQYVSRRQILQDKFLLR